MQKEPNRAMRNLKDVLTAYRYHQDATINSNLQKQSKRVGELLDRLDSIELPKVEIKIKDKKVAKYEKIGLKDMWEGFIQAQAEKAKSKAETYLDKYVAAMKKQVDPKNADPVIAGLGPRIEKLEEEVAKMKADPWKNPF